MFCVNLAQRLDAVFAAFISSSCPFVVPEITISGLCSPSQVLANGLHRFSLDLDVSFGFGQQKERPISALFRSYYRSLFLPERDAGCPYPALA